MPVATAAPTPSSTKAEKIGLLCHFAKLDDPRQSAKVMYPLVEIVFLVVCATIADCDDNVAICEWGRHHLDFLRRFLRFPDEIPSHDALGDVLNAIDPELFEQCFMDWIGGLRDGDPDILAIDASAAAAAPGVIGVYTHADLAADGLGASSVTIKRKRADG